MRGLFELVKNKIQATRWSAKIQNHIAKRVHEMNNGKNVTKDTAEIYQKVLNKLNDGEEYTFDECIAITNETLDQIASEKHK
jgi:hypothetical protein